MNDAPLFVEDSEIEPKLEEELHSLLHTFHSHVVEKDAKMLLEYGKVPVSISSTITKLVLPNPEYLDAIVDMRRQLLSKKIAEIIFDKVRKLKLKEGDAAAIQAYFSKMQSLCPGFFFSLDLDDEGQLKNVFGQIIGVGKLMRNLEM
ncbi:hypothetical protein ZIOFF_048527 [Zingiber officinale]|uniref:Uncharacterized protein n=1 Tax=Zingiber officinale TaxID=94328 RepID=A0A8J5KUD2_ZINOF|nr:hypothetical protein ZIOFF_048527 [Zingiber officinale]